MSNKNERYIFEVDKIEISNYAEIEKKDLKGVLKCKNKVEEFLEHKYKIVILCLVAIIVVEFLLINNKSKLLRMIFLTKDNEFQWLAGTAIAAMLTFLFTSINTIKKNKADLVARARIEWINDVRGILAIYLSDINNSTLYYSQLNRKYSKLTDTQAKNKLSLETKGQEDVTRLKKEIDETSRNYEKLVMKIIKNNRLLHLHLSNNEDNKQLKECIDDCLDWVKQIKSQIKSNEFVEGKNYNKTVLNNLLLVASDYLKREWNKAKKGE